MFTPLLRQGLRTRTKSQNSNIKTTKHSLTILDNFIYILIISSQFLGVLLSFFYRSGNWKTHRGQIIIQIPQLGSEPSLIIYYLWDLKQSCHSAQDTVLPLVCYYTTPGPITNKTVMWAWCLQCLPLVQTLLFFLLSPSPFLPGSQGSPSAQVLLGRRENATALPKIIHHVKRVKYGWGMMLDAGRQIRYRKPALAKNPQQSQGKQQACSYPTMGG